MTIDGDEEEECTAIPFIKFVPEDGKFQLGEEAEEFLKGLTNTKLGVVAVCGKYRTGKSYLMNKLFVETYFQKKGGISKTGFQVSPTINACTKGLWLWKRVIKTQSANGEPISMIIVDTEGLGAYDEDENHDAKIFLLALLLSSLLIYNSVGTIDENALNSLSLVINLSKQIQLKSGNDNQDSQEDVDTLAKMFPSFLWVLRDFALRLVDPEGNKMTPKQYLESALKEQKGCSEAAESKNRLRRLLSHFFQERDCCTLVRPTESEKSLQSLISLPDSELREEFVDQMSKLKQKVMGKAKVKMLNGHALNGPMLIELANSYIKALNDGEVPVIENAWTNVQKFEQERAYKAAQDHYQSQISLRLKKAPNKVELDVKLVLKEIKDQTFQTLKREFLGDTKALETYQAKLADEIKLHSKAAVLEIQVCIDQAIKEVVVRRIQEDIEARVRRCDPALLDSDALLGQAEQHLTSLQELLQDSKRAERVEFLYRQYFQSRLPKYLEAIHSAHCKMPQNTSLRTMEHKVKLAEDDATRYKEERQSVQRESYEKSALIERERQELIRKEKVLEIKLAELELKLKEAQKQIKQVKPLVDIGMQTDKPIKGLCFDRMIQAAPFTSDETIQVDQRYARATSSCGGVVSPAKNRHSSIGQDDPFTNSEDELQRANQALQNALEQAERRCSQLEKRVELKTKYETLVKNCQRLQCQECNKLYTPPLFHQHFQSCKRASLTGGRTSSVMGGPSTAVVVQPVQHFESFSISHNQQDESVQQYRREDVDDDEVLQEAPENDGAYYEGGEAQHQFSSREDFDDESSLQSFERDEDCTTSSHEYYTSQSIRQSLRKEEKPLQATVVEIVMEGGNAGETPYFKRRSSNLQLVISLVNKGKVSHLKRSLVEVKSLMTRVQKRMRSPGDQSQIERWLLELDQQSGFKVIGEIVDAFFSQVLTKLMIESQQPLKLDKQVIVEDIEDVSGPHYQYYVNEIIEFFQISDQARTLLPSDQWAQQSPDQIESHQLKTQNEGPRRFQMVESVDSSLACVTTSAMAQEQGRRLTSQGNYNQEDEEDGVVYNGRGSYPNKSIIVMREEEGARNKLADSSCINESNDPGHPITTMHLDGDISVNALQMISFFSNEEDHVRKELLDTSQELSGDETIVYNQGSVLAPISNILRPEILEVRKKSYQSPPPKGKKAQIDGKLLIATGLTTQQHQVYFNPYSTVGPRPTHERLDTQHLLQMPKTQCYLTHRPVYPGAHTTRHVNNYMFSFQNNV